MYGRLRLYLVLALVPLTGLAAWLTFDDLQEDQARARSDEQDIARLVNTELDSLFTLSRSVVSGLSTRSSDAEVCRSLVTWRQSFPQFVNIGILEVDGVRNTGATICAATPADHPNFALSGDESAMVQRLSLPGQMIVSSIRPNRSSGQPVLPVSSLICVMPDGRRRTVTASLSLSWLNAELNRILLPRNAELLILDSRGLLRPGVLPRRNSRPDRALPLRSIRSPDARSKVS